VLRSGGEAGTRTGFGSGHRFLGRIVLGRALQLAEPLPRPRPHVPQCESEPYEVEAAGLSHSSRPREATELALAPRS
jgi:hypothetical protein